MDNLDENRLLCQLNWGKSVVIGLQGNTIVSQVMQQYLNEGPCFMKVHYKFSPTKSFIYMNIVRDPPISSVGVSLTQYPLENDIFAGSSLTQIPENMPNFFNSTPLFSLNDVFFFDFIGSLTRDSSGVVLKDAICDGFFAYTGLLKQCLPECPSKHVIYADHQKECTDACQPDDFSLSNDPLACLKESCLDYNPILLFKGDFASKECITECQDDFALLTPDHRCVEDCLTAGFRFELVEEQACAEECSGVIFDQNKCLKECPLQARLVENNHCIAACSSDRPFIENYNECVENCDSFRFEEFCVSSCSEAQLEPHFMSIGRLFESKPFVLGNRECTASCGEGELVNEENMECITDCPPCQGNCEFSHLKYKDDSFCRASCGSLLTDNVSLECLLECRLERPFQLNKACLDECPKDHPLELNNCEEGKCWQECVSECPSQFPLILEEGSCVEECPEHFSNNQTKCELFCDPSLGLVQNLEGNGCIHCFTDLGMFQFEGECVESCPSGYTFNQTFVCQPCDSLGLWRNEANKCIPLSKCNSLSFFDFSNKTCTLCNTNSRRIVKRRNIYSCEQTDCIEGFVSSELRGNVCVICEQSELFADPDCGQTCPNKLAYRFSLGKCDRCESECSCCLHGKCLRSMCECNLGWTGRFCDVSIDQISAISNRIVSFLTNQLINTTLPSNQNALLVELAVFFKASSKRMLNRHIVLVKDLLSNLIVFFETQHTQFAFQPALFTTIDRSIILANAYFDATGDSSLLEAMVDLLLDFSNQIQLFNITMSLSADFEPVYKAVFEGLAFKLAFGPDVLTKTAVDIRDCLQQSTELEGTLAFRVISFFDMSLKPSTKAFVASQRPLTLLWLYLPSGMIDSAELCDSRFVTTSFQADLPVEDSLTKTVKNSGVNVFDKQDPFFNDRCVPFSDESDLTLNQRKTRFYVDAQIVCAESAFQICSIEEQDNQAVCICKGTSQQPKSALESTFLSYPKSNYILVSCTEVFRESNLLSNPGFLVIMIPWALCLLLMIWCNWKIDLDLAGKARFQYMRTDIEIFDPSQMEAEIYFQECFRLGKNAKRAAGKSRRVNRGRVRKAEFDFSSLPTLPDLAKLPADQRLRLDQRPTWQYTVDTLLSFNTLLETMFSRSLTQPKPFVILLYTCELNLNATLNAFFIDDDLVEAFSARENNSMIASFLNELPKTIWALLTAKILMTFLTIFFTFSQRAERLLLSRLTKTRDESAVKAYSLFMSAHSIRLGFLILLSVPFNLCCMYFSVIYTEIYPKSIKIWVNGILMGLIIDNLVIQGLPAISLIISRTLAKWNKQFEGLFRLISNVELLKILKALR